MITRIRTWLRERAQRRLLADIVRNADAALAARGRKDDAAFKRHATEARRLAALRERVLPVSNPANT